MHIRLRIHVYNRVRVCVYIESVLVGNIMIRRRECVRVLWSATEGVSSASFGVAVCVWVSRCVLRCISHE